MTWKTYENLSCENWIGWLYIFLECTKTRKPGHPGFANPALVWFNTHWLALVLWLMCTLKIICNQPFGFKQQEHSCSQKVGVELSDFWMSWIYHHVQSGRNLVLLAGNKNSGWRIKKICYKPDFLVRTRPASSFEPHDSFLNITRWDSWSWVPTVIRRMNFLLW